MYHRDQQAPVLTLMCVALAACAGGSSSDPPSSTSGASSSSSSSTSSSSSSSSSSSTSALPPPSTTLAIKAVGSNLVDASGNVVQLRGANVSALEFYLIEGGNPSNPWGGATGTQPNGSQTPPWSLIASTWDINVVRIPLNEASWLALTCTDVDGAYHPAGTVVNADPDGNYKATVEAAVSGANAAGMYVILDLHWAAPGDYCPLGQNEFLDSDHSLAFWTSLATTFSNNPAVIFEAFNEPIPYFLSSSSNYWTLWTQGGTFDQLFTFGNPYQVSYTWSAPSMQTIVNTIRATGANNVILISGESWSGDLSSWLASVPTDTLSPHQIGAVWHAYPLYSATSYTDPSYLTPNNENGNVMTQIQSILAAGYPVVTTEYGDQNTVAAAAGAALSTTAPFAAEVLTFADANGVSYVAWTWDVWQNPSNVLITDAAGDPTPGFGAYVQAHYLCRGAGNTTCP
jgi:endoglucanase